MSSSSSSLFVVRIRCQILQHYCLSCQYDPVMVHPMLATACLGFGITFISMKSEGSVSSPTFV